MGTQICSLKGLFFYKDYYIMHIVNDVLNSWDTLARTFDTEQTELIKELHVNINNPVNDFDPPPPPPPSR